MVMSLLESLYKSLYKNVKDPALSIFRSPWRPEKSCVVSRSAKWGGSYLGGSSWNRPQRPNPGHLRDCWGCLGRFLGRLGHRTTAIVSTRGVRKSLEFRPGAPRDFFQVDRNARE